jgi:AbrB family looped-hinge helix DNA binding protein
MSTRSPATSREPRSVGKIGQRRQVVIPKDMLDDLGMREGDFVEFEKARGRLVIKRKEPVDAEHTLTAAEAKIVRKGERQLRRGQSRPWADIKHDLDL